MRLPSASRQPPMPQMMANWNHSSIMVSKLPSSAGSTPFSSVANAVYSWHTVRTHVTSSTWIPSSHSRFCSSAGPTNLKTTQPLYKVYLHFSMQSHAHVFCRVDKIQPPTLLLLKPMLMLQPIASVLGGSTQCTFNFHAVTCKYFPATIKKVTFRCCSYSTPG